MKIILLSILISFSVATCFSQSKPVDELRLSLNEDGTQYLKLTFLNQVWLRFNESNPGSTVLGEKNEHTFDIGLRRTRVQFYGQLSEHVFFYTQFGQNNFNYLSQNSGNRKLQVFFHDALAEYKLWKQDDRLKIGAGLTITNGLSRFSQPSIGTIMTLDVPVFAQATVDQTDEFSRKLSLYARGQIGKFDYRVTISDPFPITTNGQPKPVVSEYATFAQTGHHKQYQGFFVYNIFDKEPHVTPYMAGTYLGKKKVLNIEAGFITQKDATETGTTDAVTGSVTNVRFYRMNLFSVALFYDAPLSRDNGSAFSAYAGYFNLDYGKGYLRYNGIMNPADGIINGPMGGSQGNAFPMFGTGEVIYTQVGYLFPGGTIMPYMSLMHGTFDRISGDANIMSTGINWFIKGHKSKITIDWQNRPVFENNAGRMVHSGNRNQVLLQYQIFI